MGLSPCRLQGTGYSATPSPRGSPERSLIAGSNGAEPDAIWTGTRGVPSHAPCGVDCTLSTGSPNRSHRGSAKKRLSRTVSACGTCPLSSSATARCSLARCLPGGPTRGVRGEFPPAPEEECKRAGSPLLLAVGDSTAARGVVGVGCQRSTAEHQLGAAPCLSCLCSCLPLSSRIFWYPQPISARLPAGSLTVTLVASAASLAIEDSNWLSTICSEGGGNWTNCP